MNEFVNLLVFAKNQWKLLSRPKSVSNSRDTHIR